MCRESSGGYRFLEHVSDAYLEAWGKSLENAFEWAAKAMFEIITDTSKVRPEVEVVVSDVGTDVYNALYKWLEDLLIEHQSSNLVFSRFKVDYIKKSGDTYVFRGHAWGEPFDLSKHESRIEVKAVTYSLMEVKRRGDLWYVRVVLDI
ncbi:MAG: archease [Thermoprotei archaeon]|nr:MAG: archease [Thermoprotei archaeon]